MTFVKIINVDKNNKRVYYKFLVNVASVYYIYGLSHVSGRHVLVGQQYRASVVTDRQCVLCNTALQFCVMSAGISLCETASFDAVMCQC